MTSKNRAIEHVIRYITPYLALREKLRKIGLDMEEILDEARGDLDRDIIVTACKSILSKIDAVNHPYGDEETNGS